MPALLPARCGPDSVRGFRAAASVRYRDGCVLADADRRLAAVYLWGYAVEMALKSAYFAAVGHADDDAITAADLAAAKSFAPSLGFTWAGNMHNLAAWGQLLVRSRANIPGRAYPDPAFAGAVIARSQRLYAVWRETLRYHPNTPYPFEVGRVREAAEWFLARSRDL